MLSYSLIFSITDAISMFSDILVSCEAVVCRGSNGYVLLIIGKSTYTNLYYGVHVRPNLSTTEMF